MAREFPISTYMSNAAYPGLTGITYDYTNSIYALLENGDLELGNYPDGLLWGGISKNDCPYLYPSKMIFDPNSKTLSITRLNDGNEQSATYPDAQIGYMYSMTQTFASSTWPAFLRTTNWRVDSPVLDWNTYKTITNVSGFNLVTNFANTYICSETPVNRTCPVVYALAIHKASYNALPQKYNPSIWWPSGIVQEMCIKDIEAGTASYYNQYTNTTYNNLGINDIILVGFKIQEYGVITGFTNTDVIHAFGTNDKNKIQLPINNLMGLYAQSAHLASAWKNYSSVLIPSKYVVDSNLYENELLSQDLDRAKINYVYSNENHYIGDFGGYRNNNAYISGTVVGAGMGYNGDATFDISEIMDMYESGGSGYDVYIRPYTAGDKYVFMSAPERLSGYSNIGYQQLFVYQVFDTLDDLYRYIAGFGMAFTIATRSLNMRDISDGIYSNDVFAPILDNHNVYHGEYTRGADNPNNSFFALNSINDSDFEPSDGPEPEPSEINNFYFGDKKIESLYYGNKEIKALYYGQNLIFPTTPPTPSNPYTEISYIEATGTQYINTGYTQQSNSLRIKMTVRPAFMGNTGKLIAAPNFGLKVVWYGTIQGRFYGINFYVNDGALFSGSVWHDPQSYFTEVEAILNPTTAKLLQDGGTSGSGAGSDASISASSPYCIFSEAGQELLQCQLSACQIYDNEVLVRDFIPVLRNSDNKPGLLDRVSNQFYTNAGTGEFIYYE